MLPSQFLNSSYLTEVEIHCDNCDISHMSFGRQKIKQPWKPQFIVFNNNITKNQAYKHLLTLTGNLINLVLRNMVI